LETFYRVKVGEKSGKKNKQRKKMKRGNLRPKRVDCLLAQSR
jgi:hypothetical protein